MSAGQTRAGTAYLGLRWYASPNCTGESLDQPRLETRNLDVWVALSKSAVAPEGTQSAGFLVSPSKVEAGGQLEALYDELFLTPANGVLTTPSLASIHGAAGTFFHTDLWVMNLSRTNVQNITARYRCFRVQTCDAGRRHVLALRSGRDSPR
ncbi:MAG: hypothetical protein ACM3JH_12585 [Acidithiobacillales bacterium]